MKNDNSTESSNECKPMLAEYNAKLFTASPDLLKACWAGFALCDKLQFPTEEELKDMRDIFKKVIEKALT